MGGLPLSNSRKLISIKQRASPMVTAHAWTAGTLTFLLPRLLFPFGVELLTRPRELWGTVCRIREDVTGCSFHFLHVLGWIADGYDMFMDFNDLLKTFTPKPGDINVGGLTFIKPTSARPLGLKNCDNKSIAVVCNNCIKFRIAEKLNKV